MTMFDIFRKKKECYFCDTETTEMLEVEEVPMYSGYKRYIAHDSCLRHAINNPENYKCRDVDYALEFVNQREYRQACERSDHHKRLEKIGKAKELLDNPVDFNETVCED